MIKRLICLIIIIMGLYYIYDNNLWESKQLVRDLRKEVYMPATNKYTKENLNFSFAKMTTDFVPDNKQELIDIYYTVINSGYSKFVFYCNYDKCLDDVSKMSEDSVLLSNLNSFVSPYNSYSTISTYTTPALNKKVEIEIKKTYNKQAISDVSKKIDEIYSSLNLDNYDTKGKIRTIHDYIIDHTKYDNLKINNIKDNTYHSTTAYGLLFEEYAVCSGYADTMALFLDKMNIPNMKVASATHVWNLIYLDNKWYHLDLTWDDPYSADGTNTKNYNFFLIDYNTLKNWNTKEHVFDETIYKEAIN